MWIGEIQEFNAETEIIFIISDLCYHTAADSGGMLFYMDQSY